jgi:hypothetical protein
MGTLGWSALAISLIVGLLTRWIGAEFGAWLEPFCKLLITRATKGYSIAERLDLESEWLAIIDDTPSPTRKLSLAVGYWYLGYVTKTALEDRGSFIRKLSEQIAHDRLALYKVAIAFLFPIFALVGAAIMIVFIWVLIAIQLVSFGLAIIEGIRLDTRTGKKARGF